MVKRPTAIVMTAEKGSNALSHFTERDISTRNNSFSVVRGRTDERLRADAGLRRPDRRAQGLESDALSLPRRSIQLVSGEKSRDKRVRIEGLDEAAVRTRLLGS
jgi:hypothetical protein